MTGFIIWATAGLLFVILGLYALISKKEKPIGFWANAWTFSVNDVRGYNKAMGKLWCGFGMVFIFLGLPLLAGQNNPVILISVAGTMVEVILLMVIYVTVIEKKYRKK